MLAHKLATLTVLRASPLNPPARSCIVSAGELIGCSFNDYPNVKRWLANMAKLQSWASVNEVMYGFAGSLKGQQFETV